MPLWALLALAAGSLQAARNALARSFAFQLSPALNSWARFAFNLPFSSSLVLGLSLWHGAPALSASFLAGCLLTAITQLLGNVALVAAFRQGNFAQAIALHKLEVVLLTVWLRVREPGALNAVGAHWRRMAALGASAFGGSICWYWAYSLTLVAYVKAVGQFEAVVAVILSLTVWHEREALRQIPGVALVLVGIGLVLMG